MANRPSRCNAVLHIFVVGFHHKKGCVVEYAYPPLSESEPQTGDPSLPAHWTNLPSLCLPDGSHNFNSDTSYFCLPAAVDLSRQAGEGDVVHATSTVFGVSCYRQISRNDVTAEAAGPDVTRSSIQKAVCVICRHPFFGHIHVKLALITESYFESGDFGRYDIIQGAFHHLNHSFSSLTYPPASLLSDTSSPPTDIADVAHTLSLSSQSYASDTAHHGLSVRGLLQLLGHKTLLLFKLMLIEKRLLWLDSPVADLSTNIVTLASLHPGLLSDEGLAGCCLNGHSFQQQHREGLTNADASTDDSDAHSDVHDAEACDETSQVASLVASGTDFLQTSTASVRQTSKALISDWLATANDAAIDLATSSSTSTVSTPSEVYDSTLTRVHRCANSSLHLPLQLFRNVGQSESGVRLFHPYLSLPYISEVERLPSTSSYVIGVSNSLFALKAPVIADAFVSGNSNSGPAPASTEKDGDQHGQQHHQQQQRSLAVTIYDGQLRRALTLTTDDIKFVNHLLAASSSSSSPPLSSTVSTASGSDSSSSNVLNDGATARLPSHVVGIGFIGSEQWLRANFKLYATALLHTAVCSLGLAATQNSNSNTTSTISGHADDGSATGVIGGSKHFTRPFNAAYVEMFKESACFRNWLSSAADPQQSRQSDVLSVLSDAIGGVPVHPARLIAQQQQAGVEKGLHATQRVIAGTLSSAKDTLSSVWSALRQ